MAEPKDTDVYLEAVETTQNENEKLDGLGVASHLKMPMTAKDTV